jgi:AcrR family transcriptional regulator
MPRRSPSRPTAPTSADDPRERILAAAERCIDRHGIRKTTMDDVASEVGLSRPNVYRYLADRDDLLIELITRHARALLARARKSISRQGSLADQIVEAILHTADHSRRDPLTRYVIDPDGTSLGKRMIASGTTETCRAEMWDPLLDAAVANNELPPGLPLEDGEGDVRRYRSILRRFVAPAFASAKANAGASKRPGGRHTRSRG